jgi:predicted Rossmann-fold nucleotide-binding protein
LFEIITLVQTKKEKPVPIILYGSSYWKRLINFDVMIEEGAIERKDLGVLNYCDTPQAAWEVIRDFYQLGDSETAPPVA